MVIRAEGASFSAGLHRQMLTPGGCLVRPTSSSWLPRTGSTRRSPASSAGSPSGGRYRPSSSRRSRATRSGRVPAGPGGRPAPAGRRRPALYAGGPARAHPGPRGTGPLVNLVGYARALEICATGRFVGAREASELGLATAVVPRADLDTATADLVAALLATPEGSLGALKPLLAMPSMPACRPAGGGAGGPGRVAARAGRARPGLTRTTGEPIHVDPALDAYRIGIASVDSTRDDHGLDHRSRSCSPVGGDTE